LATKVYSKPGGKMALTKEVQEKLLEELGEEKARMNSFRSDLFTFVYAVTCILLAIPFWYKLIEHLWSVDRPFVIACSIFASFIMLYILCKPIKLFLSE